MGAHIDDLLVVVAHPGGRLVGGWVVRGDTSAMFVPSADFAQDSDQRAFIGAVLARLTDKARARSTDARVFAGDDQVPISA